MDSKDWLSSKEAMREARIQACDLMHYRTAGKLKYIKKGNAFFYDNGDVSKLKNE